MGNAWLKFGVLEALRENVGKIGTVVAVGLIHAASVIAVVGLRLALLGASTKSIGAYERQAGAGSNPSVPVWLGSCRVPRLSVPAGNPRLSSGASFSATVPPTRPHYPRRAILPACIQLACGRYPDSRIAHLSFEIDGHFVVQPSRSEEES